MTKLVTLYSGSTGNASVIYNENTKILIDVGKSAKATINALADLNIDPNSLDAILITHEHGDHIKGLKVFGSKFNVPTYSKDAVLNYIHENEKCFHKAKLIPIKNEFYINDIYINVFKTSHDSRDSCGFTFTDENYIKNSIITDTGEVSDDIIQNYLCKSENIILEANYDDAIIDISSYPAFLKKRIKSSTGHLSNKQCGEAIFKLAKLGTKNFLLAHLSKENNMPILALQTVKYNIEDKSLVDQLNIKVADRDLISYI
ncbi:MAG: MBL fold metallo-hydrolase [Oscillospiraceae bacterium]